MAQKRSQRVEWLKTQLKEGPPAKVVPVSQIQKMLQDRFHPDVISMIEACKIMKSAFPLSQNKRLSRGGVKQTYSLGVEVMEDTLSQPESSDRDQLVKRIHELEGRLRRYENFEHLLDEADNMVAQSVICKHGPDTLPRLDEFSFDDVIGELQSHAPELHHLFLQLGDSNRHQLPQQSALTVEEMKTVTSMCTVFNARSQRFKGLQLLMSMMLIAQGTGKQVIRVLNHGGVCLSYDATWQCLRRLIHEAGYLDMIREGHWIWIYDNLNFSQKVRHERSDTHSGMMNVTSRLAVQIKYLPPGVVNWSDSQPQKKRSELTIHDIVPSENDGLQMYNRAVDYVMRFMASHFKAFSKFVTEVPQLKSPHAVSQSIVAPMRILHQDEKYTEANIEILEQIVCDAQLKGDPQVVIGDQLTCKNMRGAKLWRLPEINPVHQLQWVNEVPGDFHFLWECQRILLEYFWGSPLAVGSLSNLRQRIERLGVDKRGKVFSTGDEFIVHAFHGHLAASICTHLNIASMDDDVGEETSIEWLKSKAISVVEVSIMPTNSNDPAYSMHRCFIHGAFQYIDLRNAIQYEDGPHIIRAWKHWLLYFLGAGRKNYTHEAVNMLCNLKSKYPPHIAYIVTHNRCANMSGKEGKAKPLDQLIEHYNLMIKEAMRASGANATKKHLEEISLCALMLMNTAKKVDQMYGVTQSGSHTTRDATGDITKIVHYLLSEGVTKEKEDSKGPGFEDPRVLGSKKMSEGKLDDYLKVELEAQDRDNINEYGEDDINYEMYDVL